MPQFCGFSNATGRRCQVRRNAEARKRKGDFKMGKSKIKMIRHYAENREDYFVVFYESGRHHTYALPDLPKTAAEWWQTANCERQEWNEAAQRYEYISSNDPTDLDFVFADVFYTGGGIWLSAAYVEPNVYCVVDSDWDDCLTWYDHNGEDELDEYPCQNMTASKNVADLDAGEMKIYTLLHDALLREMC